MYENHTLLQNNSVYSKTQKLEVVIRLSPRNGDGTKKDVILTSHSLRVKTHPLGLPVLPLVYEIVKMDSGSHLRQWTPSV